MLEKNEFPVIENTGQLTEEGIKNYKSKFNFAKFDIFDESLIKEITNREIAVLHSMHNLTKSILEFGRTLAEMRDVFLNQKQGSFINWIARMDLSKTTVYREIKRYEYFKKYNRDEIEKASAKTLEFLRKNEDKIEDSEMVEIISKPNEATKKIKQIEERLDKENQKVDNLTFEEKVKKIDSQITKYKEKIEQLENEKKRLNEENSVV